ncbi:MAG: DUF421 domain-containing protein [Clostridia bacterium]
MLITFFRAIVLYLIVLVVMRLMGKREIGQLQPFELAISIMIADLASIPMTEIGIPIFNGIVPILGLLVMHLILSLINLKSLKAREIICGKPSILIYRGKINEKELKKERFTINELEERLRGNNVVNLGDVEYAILETSGQVTVIQKPEKRNTIPEDFNIVPEYEGIPYDLVVDGKVMNKNLKAIGKNYNWLKKQVEKFDIKPEEALVVTIDGKGQIFCQKKGRGGLNCEKGDNSVHYNCNSYYSWKYCNTKLYSEINWNIIRRIRRIKKICHRSGRKWGRRSK